MINIAEILKPENEMERAIAANEEFVQGCLYGNPRAGHPEGQVIFHIRDVLGNVNRYGNAENRADLRLIGFVHDMFKFKVNPAKPRFGENHHGFIARKFVEIYTPDLRVLEVVELHDEAYNSWCKGNRKGWAAGEERARALIERLNRTDSLDLYLNFYRCDNETGDKSGKSFDWFREIVER